MCFLMLNELCLQGGAYEQIAVYNPAHHFSENILESTTTVE